jgi:7-cyano-7-deazaguanine synthase in queuosine biosynthesis
VITTSRPHGYFPDIRDALDKHRIPYDHIVTAAKPTVELYVDDLGLLPPIHALDALLYRRNRTPGKSWWTEEQETVPENPNVAENGVIYDDPEFRVIIAFTGGLDSLTMAEMAHREGLPFDLVYVDMGQEYLESERATASMLAANLYEQPLQELAGPELTEQWKHIIPGRNEAILTTIGKWARHSWGEVWFGNLGGESPIISGDKSSRFLLTMQHLYTMEGIDFRIASPLRGLDKPDLIRMWDGWGKLATLDSVKSCFHPTLQRCGTCQTCARTLLAYEAFRPGSWEHLFQVDHVGSDMNQHFRKYAGIMPRYVFETDSRYSHRRAVDTLNALSRLQDRGIWKGME